MSDTSSACARCAAPGAAVGLLATSLLLVGAFAARATPAAERLYVSDETGGNVVIVDPERQQVVARIAVGKRPRGIQLSADHSKVYVALSGSPIGGPNVDESKLPPPDRRYDGIGVVDVASQKLLRTYQSGADPETFALSHDGGSCTSPTRTPGTSLRSISRAARCAARSPWGRSRKAWP